METKIFGDKKISIRKLAASDINHPEKFQKFINSLIAEDAMILKITKKSRKDEIEWLKKKLRGIRKKQNICLVAESENKIIAQSSINLERERSNHIGGFGISIAQGYRGIGLGKYLMKTIIKMARTDLRPSPKIIELSVYEGNNPAIALYKKMSFKVVAKIPNSVQYKGKLVTRIIMHLKV